MRLVALLPFALLLLLAACGGGGSDDITSDLNDPSGSIPLPQGVTMEMAAISGAVVVGAAPPGASGAVAPATLAVDFIDNNTVARVTLNGAQSLLAYDGFTQFEAPAGQETLYFSDGPVDGVFDDDAVAMVFLTSNAAFPFVFGALTPVADIPVTGSAQYRGLGHIWTGGQDSRPNVSLDVNYTTRRVDGQIGQAIFGAPTIDLDIAEAPIVDGQFAASLTSLSPALTLDHGEITGTFFGDGGTEIAGTLLVSSPIGVAAGYYSADKTP